MPSLCLPAHKPVARHPVSPVGIVVAVALVTSLTSVVSAQPVVRTNIEAAAVTEPSTISVVAGDSTFRRHFIGSSLFTIANLLPDPPHFLQLNYGYRFTRSDAVSVEAITWTYRAPLGIPYGESFGAVEEEYPGRVRDIGVGVAYQRIFWKGLYSQIHANPMWQRYTDETGRKLQDGFHLFMTVRTGWQAPLFSDRWFIEPSVAVTAWPVRTGVPEAFAVADRKWNRYFLFEPGLHFGRRF